MPYELPELPYAYDALEPTIDEQTMRIHHGKHHQAYVDNLNKALDGTEWDGRPLEQVLANLSSLPEDKQAAVRNNGGGHANHSLFWQIMKPGGGGDPSGALGQAIADTFGDADQLKAAINDGGVKRFGSGWTWLVWDGTGLAVYSTANQDSPLMQSDVPLLGIDVWEHAYYLHYQNRRPDYLGAWWDVVNWDEVGRRFEEARELRYVWRQLRTGDIPPSSPAPAEFTDIASRSWLSPFGSVTSTRADERLFSCTFFSVTHWPVAVFQRWNWTSRPASPCPP